MVDSKFFKGESKTVEFKAKLPDKSETYMKTIIALPILVEENLLLV